MARARSKNSANSPADLGFEAKLWLETHGGKLGDTAIYGQESNPTTRRLAVMNLALRGIEADFGPEHADTFDRQLRRLCHGPSRRRLEPPSRRA